MRTVQQDKLGGTLQLQNADVEWFLSIDKNDLPEEALNQQRSTYRSIKVDGKEIEFTEGFTDLHTEVYKEIFAGRGFRIEDSRPSIELVQKIRELAKKLINQ